MTHGDAKNTGRRIVVTGGLGFIGSALVRRLLSDDPDNLVAVVDNLVRSHGSYAGVRDIVDSPRVVHYACDVADERRVADMIRETAPTHVFHLAAQTAVTLSMEDPEEDFRTNVLGTWNMLRAVKKFAARAVFVFASTNKVYGPLEGLDLVELDDRFECTDPAHPCIGVEMDVVSPVSPYAVSKASAEMMVMDAVRSAGLRGVSLRQSCIYGPKQIGSFDQGWVAHLAAETMAQRRIQITGCGKQVRDILHVDDLLDLYLLLMRPEILDDKVLGDCEGPVLDVGGGPENAVSVLQAAKELAALCGRDMDASFLPDRYADQQYFVADLARTERLTGWKPRISWRDGLQAMVKP